ncbi:amino acid permease-domain-containing protein [Umbelopsis sp. AD052]|nr:amino acid permease-domain-containing protein [Umbelopsis sp. AD052]
MMNIGQIIGTGIFSNPALIIQNCGSGGMMLVLWVVGAIFASTGVWSYLELGTMKTKQSCCFQLAIRFNNFFTVLKILLLLLLICVGFAGLAGRLPNRPDLAENFSFNGTSNNSGNYANGIYYVIFAYGGWYNLNYVIDELKDPIKNLPRCAITALSSTTILYFLANVAYLAVLPVSVIANSKLTVAANLFDTAFGGVFGGRVLPVFVGLSSFGFVGVVTYSGSRVILETARQGYLPFDRTFSKVHPKLQTPIYSLLLIYVISLIFLLAPPPGYVFQFIVAFSGYGGYLFAALSVIGLLILRRTQPDLKRPIKVPIVVALIFIVICIYTLVFVWIPPSKPPTAYPYYLPYVISIALVAVSVVLWYFKMVRNEGLERSYNAEIAAAGQKELFNDVYKDYQSTSSTTDVSTVEEEFTDTHTDPFKA